jgi:prepilin-type N-terminal cleavage/methylation domain-containing protein
MGESLDRGDVPITLAGSGDEQGFTLIELLIVLVVPASLTIYAAKTTATTYCLRSTQDGATWSVLGPALTYSANNKCN